MSDLASDNYITDFPSRMSDGRFMTDYSSNCSMNLGMQENMSSYNYRQMLIKNAEQIMKNMDTLNQQKYGCSSCNQTYVPDAEYVQKCDHTGCIIEKVSEEGIGIIRS